MMPPFTQATAPITQRPTPSLLGIPPELRTIIYTFVLHLALDIKPIDGVWLERRHRPWPNGLDGSKIAAHELHAHPLNQTIPWQQLALSCKTIAHELLLDHMTTHSYLSSIENTTWTLELRPDNVPVSASIVRIRWTKIPCPPQRLRRLVINVNGTSKALILALNLAACCGFRMDRWHSSSAPSTLNELVVNVLSPRALVFPEHRYGFKPIYEAALGESEFQAVRKALATYQASMCAKSRFEQVSVYGGGRGEQVQLDARGRAR